MAQERPDYFNAAYGIASAGFATNTSMAIATTQAAYHGFSVVAGSTTDATVTIYDSVGGVANIVDVVKIGMGKSAWIDRYIPLQAKIGLYLVATGTGVNG